MPYPSSGLRTCFVGTLLNRVYVLLALSVIVSMFGMINTLVFRRSTEPAS
jgi:hypothetical protein